jgi:hypothetical protein
MRFVVVAMLVACGPVKGDPPGDDAPDDAPQGACVEWPATNFDPCPDDTVPSQRLDVSGTTTIDTTTGNVDVDGVLLALPSTSQSQPQGLANVRQYVIAGLTIDASATLRIVGDQVVLFVVHGSATVDGTIDARASDTTPGPGGDRGCLQPNGSNHNGGQGGASQDTPDGGGGGGGGALGVQGGVGGSSDGIGGANGVATLDADLSPLRAGCGGGAGGPSVTCDPSMGCPPGGGGGGGIQISARDGIAVTGTIDAAGGGGRGGNQNQDGGGGGGSGGAIFLESETVTVAATARLCANGGAGGTGGGPNLSGVPGANGTCSITMTAQGMAAGGQPNGGNGGFAPSPAGTAGGQSPNLGISGGGGGGGVGRIRMRGTIDVSPGAIVTPAAQP